MFDRWIGNGLPALPEQEGIGCIAFPPLVQGRLTGRHLKAVPADSRAARCNDVQNLVRMNLPEIRARDVIARQRGQTLAQMAPAWLLRFPAATSTLIGASPVQQLEENIQCLPRLDFARTRLVAIRAGLKA